MTETTPQASPWNPKPSRYNRYLRSYTTRSLPSQISRREPRMSTEYVATTIRDKGGSLSCRLSRGALTRLAPNPVLFPTCSCLAFVYLMHQAVTPAAQRASRSTSKGLFVFECCFTADLFSIPFIPCLSVFTRYLPSSHLLQTTRGLRSRPCLTTK